MPKIKEDRWNSFESYPCVPGPLFIDCKQGIVERQASKLRGGVVHSGADILA